MFGNVNTNGLDVAWNTLSPNSGATWGALVSAGGVLVGAPSAWSPSLGTVRFFATGTDKHAFMNSNKGF